MNYDIKDITLADAGLDRILWADRDMPVHSLRRVVTCNLRNRHLNA